MGKFFNIFPIFQVGPHEKSKVILCFVNGKNYTSTMTIVGDKTKTGKKILVRKSHNCVRKKITIVIVNAISAEWQGEFFRNLKTSSAKSGKNQATKIMKKIQGL